MEKISPVALVVMTFAAGIVIGALVMHRTTIVIQPSPPPPASPPLSAAPLFRDLLCATVSGVSTALTAKAIA